MVAFIDLSSKIGQISLTNKNNIMASLASLATGDTEPATTTTTTGEKVEHAPQKPTTSVHSLIQFLSTATKRLSSPDFLTFLGGHLSKHPMEDRGAIFEQVVAHEYRLLWPDSSNIETEPGIPNDSVPALPDTLLSASEWAKASKIANLSAIPPRDADERNDPTLHRVLELLNYYVNEAPDPRATPAIMRAWQQLELIEERAVLRSGLPDSEYNDLLRQDRECDEWGEKCYNDLNAELPKLTPQERVARVKEIQKAGMDALTARAPNFGEMEAGEKQSIIQSIPTEERKPIIKMNVLNVVMMQMQKMQMLGQSMIQQFMQKIPTMTPEQQKQALEGLREKAFEVLPDNFIELNQEERQKAAMSVPFEKKLPVMKWNAMCAALSILANGGGHGHSHGHGQCHGHSHSHGHGH
jgi:hypothetical protein